MSIPALELGCRVALFVVFWTAAYHKLSPRAFRELLASLPDFGIPAAIANRPFAAAIIVLEIEVGLFALVAPAIGYLLALATLAGFTLGMVRIVRAGRVTSCKCFGASVTPIGRGHLIRNAILLLTASVGLVARLVGAPDALGGPAALVGMSIGALAGLAITRWEDVAFLLHPRKT